MKKRVALLFGGKSAEHDISVLSAQAIYQNIDRENYDVELFGIDKDGETFLFSEDAFLDFENKGFASAEPLTLGAFTEYLLSKTDVAFPALHGPFGEDGKIQGFFDFIKLPYVGCNHISSAICMDKAYNKYILQDNGFRITPFQVVLAHEFQKDADGIMDTLVETLGEQLFVKPANMGSSVGISKAAGREDLKRAIAHALEYDSVAVVEKAINAAEYECGVFGVNEFQATPVGEIKPSHEFYDYEAKYSEDCLSKIEIPANLSEEESNYIREESIRAAKLLRIRGLSRIDYLKDRDDGQIYLSEINTMPGFTKFSMYPSLAEKIGLSYKELITQLIELADK